MYSRYLLICRSESACDYSIGCGVRVEPIDAPDLPTAIEKARAVVMGDEPDYFSEDSEYLLDEAILVSVEQTLDVKQIYDVCRQLTETRIAASTSQEERAEYERLKAKYA